MQNPTKTTKPSDATKPSAASKRGKAASAATKPSASKAAPAKAAPAPATDAASDKAAERSALRDRINRERAEAAHFFATLDKAAVSVPVKSLAAFRKTYKRAVAAHPNGRRPTVRAAAAICAPFVCAGVDIADGASAPRQFKRGDATFAVENGALSDAIAAGLVTYSGETETLTLRAASECRALLGSALPKAKPSK